MESLIIVTIISFLLLAVGLCIVKLMGSIREFQDFKSIENDKKSKGS